MSHDTQGVVSIVSKFQVPSSDGLGEKGSPGLLNTVYKVSTAIQTKYLPLIILRRKIYRGFQAKGVMVDLFYWTFQIMTVHLLDILSVRVIYRL